MVQEGTLILMEIIMMEIGLTTKKKGTENIIINKKEMSIWEIGNQTRNKVKENTRTKMVTNMKVNLRMEKSKGMEYLNGIQGSNLKVNFKMMQ